MIRSCQYLWVICLTAFGLAGSRQTVAQDSTVAVLTQVEQVVRLSPAVRSAIGEESFPDYLAQMPALQNSIFQIIKTSLARKFSVGTVRIQQPAGPWLDYRNVVAPVHISRNRGEGNLYVAVQQIVQLTTTSADSLGMPVKNFLSTCMVVVQDQGGKTLFTTKVVQPFSTANRPGQMYGLVETSPDDWTNLLAASLQAAFETGAQRLPSRTFYRPATDAVQYGLSGTARFYILQETEKNSSYKGSNREKTVSFREPTRVPRIWSVNQSYSLNEGSLRGDYRTRIVMEDKAMGTEYDITASSSLTRDSMNVYSKTITPITIRCTAQRLLVGDFTLNEKRFEGQVGYDIYSIRAVQPRNTYEIRINDKVRAVIQKGGYRNQGGLRRQETYVYLSREVDDTNTDKVLLSYLIYQSANELGRDFLGY